MNANVKADTLDPNQSLDINLKALAKTPKAAIDAFGKKWAGRVAQSALDALAEKKAVKP